MYGFFGFFDLLWWAILIAVVYLLFSHNALKKQVNRLSERLSRQEQGGEYTPAIEAVLPRVPGVDRTEEPVKPAAAAAGPWQKAMGAKASESGDRVAAPPPPVAVVASDEGAQPRAFVFRQDKLENLGNWLRENWFFAVAALSLALSGVFLVQYGVEHGVLTPFWRVMGALALGAALIAGGEYLRRRFGDDVGGSVDYLPSTFAGAGLFSLFAGVLSARQMYNLIDPGTALAGLVAVSVIAVVLGWFYGPLLAVVGILGAVVAPFIVGGSSDAPELFYYYFALVAVAGLLVDAYKRWAWVSALVLLATFGAAWMLFESGAAAQHYLVFAVILMAAAAVIPPLKYQPQHGGTSILGALRGKILQDRDERIKAEWPEFPTRLASGAFLAANAAALMVALDNSSLAEVWLAIACFGLLFVAAALWMWKAEALEDLAIWPALGFLAVIMDQGEYYGAIGSVFRAELTPEAALPKAVSVLVAIALAGSVLAFWRGRFSNRLPVIWGAGAALLAPVAVVLLEVQLTPAAVLGAGNWALHVMVVAAVMVFFAERTYRSSPEHGTLNTALYAMAALTMISLALMIMLSEGALTLALAVMVLLTALIDRRFKLPLLALFVQIGTVVIGWRIIVDPGVTWAFENAGLWDLLVVFGSVIVLLAATWLVLKENARLGAMVTVESAIWTFGSILVVALLYRWMDRDVSNHWGLSLFGLVWLISMVNQMYRMKSGGRMRWVRGALAAVFGLLGFGFVGVAWTFFNPLENRAEVVVGPPVFDSLMLALVPIAVVFGVAAWKLSHFSQVWRRGFMVLSALFAAAYVGMEIRRLWQGPVLADHGVMQGELYSYTVAMLLASVGLLFFAFSRRSVGLRKLAIAGIGLTIAKVFLIDMSGLNGLVRVASFLGLGLSLAGLAWVNRRMTQEWGDGDAAPDAADT